MGTARTRCETTRLGMMGLLVPLLFGVVAQGQLTLDVEIGFNGRYFPDHYTPIRVKIEYRGPLVSGELVLHQEVERPLEEIQTIELRRAVRLSGVARLSYELYFPLSNRSPPYADDPELIISFTSQGRELASRRVSLADTESSDPLVLMLSEAELLKILPTAERVEYISAEDLPRNWKGYEGVRRLYLGRFDLHALRSDQQDALLQWLVHSGELVVLSGENFPLQDTSWLRGLIPFRPEGLRRFDELGAQVVIGRPLGEVVYSDAGLPLLVRDRVGRGRVYFSTLALSGSGGAEREVWKRLIPSPSDLAHPPPLGLELLREMELRYPNKALIGGLMALYVIGFAIVTLRIIRRTPLRWESLEDLPRGVKGWQSLLMIISWIALFVALTVGYLQQPALTRRAQSVEVGYVWASDRALCTAEGAEPSKVPCALIQTWYSVIVKRTLPLELLSPRDALVLPLERTGVALTIEPKHLRIAFTPTPMMAGEQKHLYVEEVIPFKVRVEVETGGAAGVRRPVIRVYNESRWHLREMAYWHEGIYQLLGDLPPGEAREMSLSEAGTNVWPGMEGLEGRLGFGERVRQRLYQGFQEGLERSKGLLLAWVEDEGLKLHPEEDRWRLKLLIVELTTLR